MVRNIIFIYTSNFFGDFPQVGVRARHNKYTMKLNYIKQSINYQPHGHIFKAKPLSGSIAKSPGSPHLELVAPRLVMIHGQNEYIYLYISGDF